MEWIYSSEDSLWQTVVLSLMVFVLIIVVTRIVGLRSFAKFSVYDFAFTVAVGSVLAGILTSSTSFVKGALAISCFLFLKVIFSYFEKTIPGFKDAIANDPILLMEGSTIIEENMKSARVNRSQLIAKLREANVLSFDDVAAVVLEETGDISVLHKENANGISSVQKEILEGVRRKP